MGHNELRILSSQDKFDIIDEAMKAEEEQMSNVSLKINITNSSSGSSSRDDRRVRFRSQVSRQENTFVLLLAKEIEKIDNPLFFCLVTCEP